MKNHGTKHQNTINNYNDAVEKVEHVVFLGSVVPHTSNDVKRRIALASSAFGRLKKNTWSRRDLSNSIKLKPYSLFAVYVSETWTLKAEDTRKLLVFENDVSEPWLERRDCCKIIDIKSGILTRKPIKTNKKNYFETMECFLGLRKYLYSFVRV